MPLPEPARHVEHLHQLYRRLTGQNLSLRFDRQRFWYEFLKAGFTESDSEQVITYLQREIRAGRRNVGALKLSNLLQLDRFEEDLNISRVHLRSPPPARHRRLSRRPNPCPLPSNNKAGRKLSGTFDNLKRISAFFSRTNLISSQGTVLYPLYHDISHRQRRAVSR